MPNVRPVILLACGTVPASSSRALSRYPLAKRCPVSGLRPPQSKPRQAKAGQEILAKGTLGEHGAALRYLFSTSGRALTLGWTLEDTGKVLGIDPVGQHKPRFLVRHSTRQWAKSRRIHSTLGLRPCRSCKLLSTLVNKCNLFAFCFPCAEGKFLKVLQATQGQAWGPARVKYFTREQG